MITWPGLENGFLKARKFVDLQSKAVTGPMKETRPGDHPYFRRKTAIREQLLDRRMQFEAINARLHLLERHLLSGTHGFPKSPLLLAGAATHDRPGHVAVIATGRITRKDVQNDKANSRAAAEPRSCGSQA